MPKISIIVPVFKVEKLLPRCINSILVQTFKDFELILIDDGSPDNCPQICDDYAIKDSRVRVFHKENGGVSSARNLGLDNALGDWISFIDSDDWVDESYIQNLYDSLEIGSKGLVTEGRINEYPNHSVIKQWEQGTFNRNELKIIFENYNLTNHGFPWGRLYEACIIKENNLRFDTKISHAEDLLFLLQYLNLVQYIKFINASDYHYECNNVSSLSKWYGSFDEELYAFRKIRGAFIDLVNCNDVDIDNLHCSLKNLSESGLRAIKSLYRGKNRASKKERLEKLRNKIDQFDIDFFVLCCKYVNMSDRIIILLLKNHKTLLDLYLVVLYKLHK